MTATEASRSFASLLDAAERGESFIITRAGRRIATVGPATGGNGAAVKAVAAAGADPEFAATVETARAAIVEDGPAWRDA